MEIRIIKEIEHQNRTLKEGYRMIVSNELGKEWIRIGIAEAIVGFKEEEDEIIARSLPKEEETHIHLHIDEEE